MRGIQQLQVSMKLSVVFEIHFHCLQAVHFFMTCFGFLNSVCISFQLHINFSLYVHFQTTQLMLIMKLMLLPCLPSRRTLENHATTSPGPSIVLVP